LKRATSSAVRPENDSRAFGGPAGRFHGGFDEPERRVGPAVGVDDRVGDHDRPADLWEWRRCR
jgi:hypothetical protein